MHFRNKKREYMKDRIDELAMNSKNKNIRDLYRGINDFKRGYQHRSNLVKDENGDLLADPHTILPFLHSGALPTSTLLRSSSSGSRCNFRLFLVSEAFVPCVVPLLHCGSSIFEASFPFQNKRVSRIKNDRNYIRNKNVLQT
jgi:hypothetical protein